MGTSSGFSLKLLTCFVVFVAGRELFRFYAESSQLVANLVGLSLWAVVMYIDPPRPRPFRLLLVTSSLVLIVVALHFLHVG